jgi:hypothetical protein
MSAGVLFEPHFRAVVAEDIRRTKRAGFYLCHPDVFRLLFAFADRQK